MNQEREFPFRILEKVAITFGVLAICSLVFCIYIFSTRTTAIHTNASIDSNIWANFGTLTSGFVGSVFSIVTVLLLYMAYKAQKNEMEATRQVMLDQSRALNIQQFENTFFKLLDNHSKLFKNLEVNIPTSAQLDGFATSHKTKLEHYKFYMTHKKIFMTPLFNYHPFKDPIFKNELVVKIINDINHASNFILSKTFLNEADNLFYFSTLFNALLDSEKYFYGAQEHLGIARFIDHNFGKANSSYNDYYNQLDDRFKIKYSDAEHFYPTINLTFRNSAEELNIQFVRFSHDHPLIILKNTHSSDIKVEKIQLIHTTGIKTNKWYTIKYKSKISLSPNDFHTIDLYNFIDDFYFKGYLDQYINECNNNYHANADNELKAISNDPNRNGNLFVMRISIVDSHQNKFKYYAEFLVQTPQSANFPFYLNIKDWYDKKMVEDVLSVEK